MTIKHYGFRLAARLTLFHSFLFLIKSNSSNPMTKMAKDHDVEELRRKTSEKF